MLYIQEVVLETITEATSSTEASIHSTYYHLFLSRFSNYTQYYYIILNVHHFCTFFFFLFRPYGGSQAWGPVGDTAAGLHHSHSNLESEPHL